MDEMLEVLRREFDAEEGSFLLRLRGMEWDRDAFTRLERAMRAACEHFQANGSLDRWVAEGFYAVATWVPVWTSHPGFPRPRPDGYYEACIERIGDLADWFFRGFSNYVEGHVWAEL
ncbi:hypothetical protein [Yinghuangia seranimata]|uniref:hypothetical protein n=1 Tax=Yinghuangia seranimata TaxID=408067 RepID=UPI00248C690B|nr:hypothetical protein [Yinghuangia seranimata]MDI2127122.1 hypothetical protein [Yinghuangia seranimata]